MKINISSRHFLSPSVYLLVFCLFVSFISIYIYYKEIDSTDEALFFILSILRYSSFIIFVCSVYIFIVNLIRAIAKAKTAPILGMIISFLCALYGAGIFILEMFILSFTAGV